MYADIMEDAGYDVRVEPVYAPLYVAPNFNVVRRF